MWLATKHGFYSIVEKTPGVFHLRGREKADLDNLWELAYAAGTTLAVPEHWPDADYAWRIIADRDQAMQVLALLARSIDYDNFKSEIGRTPGQRHKVGAYGAI